MERPEKIEFATPPPFGWLMVWLGLPLLGVIIAFIIAASLYAILSAQPQSSGILTIKVKGSIMFGAGLWMAAAFVHWFRDRHAITTSYLLCEQGIHVKPPGMPERLLLWSDFDRAVYNRPLKYIQIFSPKIDKPVTLILGSPGAPPLPPLQKLELARHLVEEKLGQRLKRQWLL